MSFSLADYPARAQERHARIHSIDLDAVECPCGAQHPGTYKLSVCEQKLCETRGCHECLKECQLHGGGKFCDLHLGPVGKAPHTMAACLRCEEQDLDAEDRIDSEDLVNHIRRVA